MGKTPAYTKRAVKNYRKKFDFMQLRIPKNSGLKKMIQAVYGKDANERILRLILDDLRKISPNVEKPPYGAIRGADEPNNGGDAPKVDKIAEYAEKYGYDVEALKQCKIVKVR